MKNKLQKIIPIVFASTLAIALIFLVGSVCYSIISIALKTAIATIGFAFKFIIFIVLIVVITALILYCYYKFKRKHRK